MNCFLHIEPVFNESLDRSISSLKTIYDDNEKLESIIKNLFQREIRASQIKNKRVLLKPNWVMHSKSELDDICLRTNDNFVLATLKVVLEMKPLSVIIGDAPIQGCNWEKMLSEDFSEKIKSLANEYEVAVSVVDFRRRIYSFSNNKKDADIRPLKEYVIFDVGKTSWLEPITINGKSNFRVTNYDPERMVLSHSPGVHKYCLTRELFESDLIISLPKIKTHQKTGITAALKNLVGFNGDKDFLPHHRIGGTQRGGDCYPGGSLLRSWSEKALDNANRRQGRKSFWIWQKLSSALWKLSIPGAEHQIAAGWYGNDTTWRMVKDLNRIVEFGNQEGEIKEHAQRMIFSLCDGIIGGEGNGPLDPEPLPLGLITLTNHSLFHDRVMADIMSLPVDKLPLLNQNDNRSNNFTMTIRGKNAMLQDLDEFKVIAKLPKGWSAIIKMSV